MCAEMLQPSARTLGLVGEHVLEGFAISKVKLFGRTCVHRGFLDRVRAHQASSHRHMDLWASRTNLRLCGLTCVCAEASSVDIS